MSMLRRFISAVSPASAPIATGAAASARERLRAAFAASDRAARAYQEATAATLRVRQIVLDADAAEANAEEAAEAAAHSTKLWAESGALADAASGNQALLDAAIGAERNARELSFKARGAKAGIPQIQKAEQAAGYVLESAKSEVGEAIRGVLFAEIDADFKLIEDSREACASAHERILTLAHTLKFGKVFGIPSSGSTDLLRRLQASLPRTPSDDDLRVLARPWIDLAKRLASDADATLDDT